VEWELELRPTRVTRLALGLVATPVALVAGAASGPIGVAIAAVYGASWLAIGRRRIRLDHHGVTVRGAFGDRAELSWADVDRYTYWSARLRGSVLGRSDRRIDAPHHSVTNTRHVLKLFGHDRTVCIDANYFGAERAAAMALGVLHPLLAERARFTPFAIMNEGLVHATGGVLPWHELDAIRIDNSVPPRLCVMKVKKSFPWRAESLGDVWNGMLLLERLADRGIAIDLGRRQLFTDTLLAAVDRGRALPRAEIVVRD
jgi:hypothetical protein